MPYFKKIEKPFQLMIEAIKMQLNPAYRDHFLNEVFYELYNEGRKDAMSELKSEMFN